jgi:hypothetical protein
MGSWVAKMVHVIMGRGGGSYNTTTGVIKHPPKGTKGPKVKTKMVKEKKK